MNGTSGDGKIIVVDAGHNYGGDYGANSEINGVKYVETDLNIQLAVKLKAELEKRGYNVIMTRDESDKSKSDLSSSLAKRADIANKVNASLFVSIHHNSATAESAKGVLKSGSPLLDDSVKPYYRDWPGKSPGI